MHYLGPHPYLNLSSNLKLRKKQMKKKKALVNIYAEILFLNSSCPDTFTSHR